MKAKLGTATVSIQLGDITDAEVDAIVNASTPQLLMGTGVAGAMKRKGGIVIEEDAVRQGPIEVGEAVLSVAGNLPATHVIHAATMGPDLKTDPALIAAATKSSLALVEKHRLTSIAFPALGSGAGGVPPAKSAEAMLGALAEHLKSGKSSLQKVQFILYQTEAQKAFTDTLKKLTGL
ncbi:MAG TPA: macro domain-containing protein [Candidatus Nitrosocosmicus sp.]|jgi:O-acetyl-ADP-ribose deacetylase (regulator of RNase III)|nr:macro domain-containing protein [Candidatus Nitrosocosmicus sp.]